jgi:hypothetical protein
MLLCKPPMAMMLDSHHLLVEVEVELVEEIIPELEDVLNAMLNTTTNIILTIIFDECILPLKSIF